MNDHLLTAMHIAQSLLNLLGILWLMLGMRNKDRTRKGYYDRLTRVHLPSSLCIYTALLLGVLTCRMQQSSDLFYLIMLCLETLLIEDMIRSGEKRRCPSSSPKSTAVTGAQVAVAKPAVAPLVIK